MKHFAIWVVCIFTLAVTAFSVLATPAKRFDAGTQTCRVLSEGTLEWETRAWGEGGKTFKQFCKNCHSRDNKHGGSFIWEESKTSKGWNNFFTRKNAQCAKDGEWDKLTQDQLLLVNDYLYRWSSTSLDRFDSG